MSASSGRSESEFDPAWICGVCGKRHGLGECLRPPELRPLHYQPKVAKTDAQLKRILADLRKRNYRAERKAATRWADHVMNGIPVPGFGRAEWLKAWGLVFDAYLAGLRGKTTPSGETVDE